jgi:uncharacterized membrane protein YdbT with pleckstrin-like domain
LLQTVFIIVVGFLLSVEIGARVRGLWVLQSLLWYVAIAALARLAKWMLEWWNEVIIVTDKRIMISSGILTKKHSIISITDVTDVTVMWPVLGRLLGYGTVRIYLIGQYRESIEYLPSPEVVFTAIADLVHGEETQFYSE